MYIRMVHMYELSLMSLTINTLSVNSTYVCTSMMWGIQVHAEDQEACARW